MGDKKKVQTSEGIASHKGHNILHNNLQENQKILSGNFSKHKFFESLIKRIVLQFMSLWDYEAKRFREQKMHVFKTMIANTNREQTFESIALPGILSNTY